MRWVGAIIILCFFIGCTSSVPRGILPPEEMKLIVFDLARADQLIENYVAKDTTVDVKKRRITLYEQVFAIHKTNRQDFYKSFKYYQQHPNKNKILFDSLNAYGSRKKAIPLKPVQ